MTHSFPTCLPSDLLVYGLYGYAIEKVAYAPLRGGPRLVPLISAIGMSIFLQNWVAIGQCARDMAVPALITGSVQFQMGRAFVVTEPYLRILIIVVTDQIDHAAGRERGGLIM